MADYSYMTRDDMEAEIRSCKALLNESDHTIIQTLEGICDCNSATGIINFLKSITEEVKATIAKRRVYRQTIHDLEELLDE
jgi:hypothetical protein